MLFNDVGIMKNKFLPESQFKKIYTPSHISDGAPTFEVDYAIKVEFLKIYFYISNSVHKQNYLMRIVSSCDLA